MEWVRCAALVAADFFMRRNAAMSRFGLLLAGIIALSSLTAGGCRSCSSCHDYDPPVAGCQCDACGTHRAGSACGGSCSTGSCTTAGCSCGNHGGNGYVDGEYAESGYGGGQGYAEGMVSE
jgi:hypothetical protein